jgi:uncharacterized protein (DUF3084 family)
LKRFRTELIQRKELEIELRQKLEEAQSTSRSIQSTVANIVKEKEQLIAENGEIKSVCEELMAMVEANDIDIKQEMSLSWM